MSARRHNKSARIVRHGAPLRSAPRERPSKVLGPGESPPEESRLEASIPLERLLRVMRKATESMPIRSPAQLDAYLAEFTDQDYKRVLDELKRNQPREHAQQLAYQAMLDAESDREALDLARRALKLDPECTDAKVVLAEIT